MADAPKFVYVAQIEYDYEGSDLVGVFLTQRAAKDAHEDSAGRKLVWTGDRKDCWARVRPAMTASVLKVRLGVPAS